MKKYIVLALILCMIFCVACQKNDTVTEIEGNVETNTQESENVKTEESEKDSMEKITLYYSDNQGMSLCKEEREVSSEDAKNPEVVIKELIKGTDNGELVNVIPKEVVINSCEVHDGVCTVDLSNEFIKIQGTAAQEMAVYSVVNTLCAIDGVDSVRFLIDGETVPVFGDFDFASDFGADMSLTK